MMLGALPRSLRYAFWGLAYLWSVSMVLCVSWLMHWQYDGDLGWWIVAGYILPAGIVFSPLREMLHSEFATGIGYVAVTLCLTLFWLIALRRHRGS